MLPRPKVGWWVLYRLAEGDCVRINATPASKRNTAHRGEVFPALVTRVHGVDCVNLQVFYDGNHQLWVTSRRLDQAGEQDGTFALQSEPASV